MITPYTAAAGARENCKSVHYLPEMITNLHLTMATQWSTHGRH